MIEIRVARPDQFAIAAELRQEMGVEMGSDLDEIGGDWRAKFCAYFGGKQNDERGQIFLAFDGERAVGMAAVALTEEWRAYCFDMRFAFINAVFVKPGYRRRGIARELMQRAIAWARERRCSRVRLRSSLDARALYEDLGFHAGREMELEL